MLPFGLDPRTAWGRGGELAQLAERVGDVGALLVERAGVEPGMDVLDVACGSGNAALAAASVSARVTALDFDAELLDLGRERAADAMVEVDWLDAGTLESAPEPGAFDRVLSVFGHMFAPDHEATAAAMRRVCRDDGRIGVACWTPGGPVEELMRAAGRRPDALRWGTEEHLRELLGEVEVDYHEADWPDLGIRAGYVVAVTAPAQQAA